MNITIRIIFIGLMLMLAACSNTRWVGSGVVEYLEAEWLDDKTLNILVAGALSNRTRDLEKAIELKVHELCECENFEAEYVLSEYYYGPGGGYKAEMLEARITISGKY